MSGPKINFVLNDIYYDKKTKKCILKISKQLIYKTNISKTKKNFFYIEEINKIESKFEIILNKFVLDNLNNHKNKGIASCAFDIVATLENEIDVPVWYLIEKLKTAQQKINFNAIELSKNNILLEQEQLLKKELEEQIVQIYSFSYFKRLRFKKKLALLEKKMKTQEKNVSFLDTMIKYIIKEQEELNVLTKQLISKLSKIENENSSKKIEELCFVPLCSFYIGDYSKTPGCFLVRNIVSSEFYIGKSNAIGKEIDKLFEFPSCKPKSKKILEHFLLTSEEEQKQMFEIMLFPTKTEKEMKQIEKYLNLVY